MIKVGWQDLAYKYKRLCTDVERSQDKRALTYRHRFQTSLTMHLAQG